VRLHGDAGAVALFSGVQMFESVWIPVFTGMTYSVKNELPRRKQRGIYGR